jgi:hypothetical protein
MPQPAKKGFLSRLEDSIGLGDPQQKWYDVMVDKALDLGIKSFVANFFFDKGSLDEVVKLDYFYLLIRIYGFFTALKLVGKGIGFLIRWEKSR